MQSLGDYKCSQKVCKSRERIFARFQDTKNTNNILKLNLQVDAGFGQLFIYCLFDNAVSSSDYTAMNGRVTNKYCIGANAERQDRGQI
jgi:hypothetical protein